MTLPLPRGSRSRCCLAWVGGGAVMLAGRAPPGAPGCRRLLAAALAVGLRPLLCGLRPCWATARRAAGQWPSPGLRVPEAAEAERLVQQAQQLQRIRAPLRRFIACPQLARTVQRCLQGGASPDPRLVLLECAPGKLTRGSDRPFSTRLPAALRRWASPGLSRPRDSRDAALLGVPQ